MQAQACMRLNTERKGAIVDLLIAFQGSGSQGNQEKVDKGGRGSAARQSSERLRQNLSSE